MNVGIAVAALVTAAHLPQVCHQLRRWPPVRRAAAGAGLVVALVALAAVADPLIDALDISAPTMQVAAGLTLVVWSAWRVVRWDGEDAPTRETAPSTLDALAPGLFPLLLTPPVGVMGVAVGARVGLLLPLVVELAMAAVLTSPEVVRWLGRRSVAQLSAALGLVMGIAVLVDGLFDV